MFRLTIRESTHGPIKTMKLFSAQLGVSVNSLVSQVNLQVITVAQCQAVFIPPFVQPSTLCTNGAGGVGVCGGDSGGPLVILRNGVPTLVSLIL